jgi:hypothetical protein
VAAISARDAWAVGRAGAEGCGCGKTPILHWDGVAWSRVPSPNLGGGIGSLSGVAFTAARAPLPDARQPGQAARLASYSMGAVDVPCLRL